MKLLTLNVETKLTPKEQVFSYQINQEFNKYENLKIGIIIPAYNEEKNIENVLKNIHNFNNSNFDIIVIDDGSTDNTCQIIDKYNVLLLKHEENKGNGAATITGLTLEKLRKSSITFIKKF